MHLSVSEEFILSVLSFAWLTLFGTDLQLTRISIWFANNHLWHAAIRGTR
jgi:hypothetical protein